MPQKTTTFREVFNKWDWKPIRNCPGRYTFAEGVSRLTITEIVLRDFPISEFASKIVSDKVLVMKFNDGSGVISYQKDEDCFLHTLNDEEGFTRKIKQLGIETPRKFSRLRLNVAENFTPVFSRSIDKKFSADLIKYKSLFY